MMNYKLYKNVLDQEEFTKLKETSPELIEESSSEGEDPQLPEEPVEQAKSDSQEETQEESEL